LEEKLKGWKEQYDLQGKEYDELLESRKKQYETKLQEHSDKLDYYFR
jgi:hypothetical protein